MPHARTPWTLCALLATIAVLLSACGSGGGASSGGTTAGGGGHGSGSASSAASGSGSLAVYQAAGDGACKAAADSIANLPNLQRSGHLTITELSRVVSSVGTRFRAAIQALHPPSSLRTAYQRLLADVQAPEGSAIALTVLARDRRLLSDYAVARLPVCEAEVRVELGRLTGRPAAG